MRTIAGCRVCNCPDLTTVVDLGEQYVSDFRDDNSKPGKYPLVGVICENCKLVQLRDTTPSGEMYHENYGFKSGISDSIKADLLDNVTRAQAHHPKATTWLDIASNDGTLLSYVPSTVYRVGVDPITKYCKEAEQYADEIINDFFPTDKFPTKKFDIVTSISCFYDMDDPNAFVKGVTDVMADDGIWDIQQNYLLPTMQLNAVDNFCHEHIEYYTLLSLEFLLEKHGLEVFDLSTSMVNGGSLRTFVTKKGSRPVQPSVEQQRLIELEAGLHDVETYKAFGAKSIANMEMLKKVVDDLNAKGKEIYILAASTRGATLWQTAGITEQDVPFALERNPEKVGKYFSAIGMPIISEQTARLNKPDYMLVGPWFFAYPEIISREKEYIMNGGALIIPLPELDIITKDNYHETAPKRV
jgi:NDP-4-keto-2,6-dideoxyhexose 3-C-methyltransferase